MGITQTDKQNKGHNRLMSIKALTDATKDVQISNNVWSIFAFVEVDDFDSQVMPVFCVVHIIDKV